MILLRRKMKDFVWSVSPSTAEKGADRGELMEATGREASRLILFAVKLRHAAIMGLKAAPFVFTVFISLCY